MLDNFLYTIQSMTAVENGFSAVLSLNPDCEIYKGHFASYPITPGVCLVQMALELIREALGSEVEIVSSKNIKFLNPVLPSQTSFLTVNANQEGCCWKIQFSDGERVYSKMSLELKA